MTVAGRAKPGPHPTPTTEPFWKAAAEGRLLMQWCITCERWQHYPRELCVRCWGEALAWREPSGSGTVWAFTIAHRPGHPAWEPDAPYPLAIVELSEGPRLLSRIVGVASDHIHVGMRVRATIERRDGYGVVLFAP